MLTTTTNWKTNMGCYRGAGRPYLTPPVKIKIQYLIVDTDTQDDAEASDNGHESYSDIAATTNTGEIFSDNIATLEHNMWMLDGTKIVKPTTPDVGYVGNGISNSSRAYTTSPTITVEFSSVVSATLAGLTIQFDTLCGEFATDFTITFYNGSTVVKTVTVANNVKTTYELSEDLTNFDKVIIAISKWCLPDRRPRIEHITFGLEKTFTNEDLFSFVQKQSSDILAFELPEYSIQYELNNVDEIWNPDKPSTIFSYIAERQKVIVYYGVEIDGAVEWVKAGTYFMAEWETPQSGISAQFTARSLIDILEQLEYTISAGTYTYYNLCQAVLVAANLPKGDENTNPWILHNDMKNASVTFADTDTYKSSEILQMCANACQCVLFIDKNGYIVFKKLDTYPDPYEYFIDRFVSWSAGDYTISKELKSVNVNSGQATSTNSTKGEIQRVSNDFITDSTVAQNVADWVKEFLKGRKTVEGEFRCDPALEIFDCVNTENKYARNVVYITSNEMSYSGAFHGKYEARVMRSIKFDDLEAEAYAGADSRAGVEYA